MSAIYSGTTTHTRKKPIINHFTYGIYMMYVDLQEAQSGKLDFWPFFSTKTPFSLLSILPRDHMINERRGQIYNVVCDVVQRETGTRPTGPIRLLTNARVLGIEFNPVSFYYVFEADGETVQCVVAEVANFPWFEQHNYVVTRTQSCAFVETDKQFHVSPFIPIEDVKYDWMFTSPAERIQVRIALAKESENFFRASLNVNRMKWSVLNMLLLQLRYPMHTLRVMSGILFEAVKLFRRGLTFYPHPNNTQTQMSRIVEYAVVASQCITEFLSTTFKRAKRTVA